MLKNKLNFLGKAGAKLDQAKIVILPVPYDGTSTWIKGADKGPDALFQASKKLELYDIETDSEAYKQGIFTAPGIKEKARLRQGCGGQGAPEKIAERVKQAVGGYLEKDKFVVTVGGEHSVTIGAVEAFKEKYPDLSVLQLDAHADLQNEYYGSKYNHGCVMARARELCPIVQVGIRSMSIEEKAYLENDRVFFAHEIINKSSASQGKAPDKNTWQAKAISKLNNKVYVTIDLDVFDPSLLPSTGTPEPGGLGWYEVLGFLRKVSEEKEIVGFDVVELCPNDQAKASDFTAAKLIYKLLSYIFEQ